MGQTTNTENGEVDAKTIEWAGDARDRVLKEIRKAIIGQDELIELALTAMVSGGHCLLVGVPGLAKTLLVSSLAKTLSMNFKRIQFTPDMMPSDITGTDVLEENQETGEKEFVFMRGPVFANLILADEINRTPPKTQAAMLEAMQEMHVTVGRETYALDQPFMVMATQNPIEQEGTYPLPEAQLDRFMFMINIDYPTKSEFWEIIKSTTASSLGQPEEVVTGDDIMELRKIVRSMPISDHVLEYITELVTATRPTVDTSPEVTRKYLSWGAGPRAGQYLSLGAKARALLRGNVHATVDDVKKVAAPVLRHRIVTNFTAMAEGTEADDIVNSLVEEIKE